MFLFAIEKAYKMIQTMLQIMKQGLSVVCKYSVCEEI